MYMQAKDVTEVGSCKNTRNNHDDGQQAAMAVLTFVTMYVVASKLVAKILKEVYTEMEIDWLLEQVPSLGKGRLRIRRVVCYNNHEKDVPLNRPAIQGLKKTKKCLTSGIVDLILLRLFLQQAKRIQREVNILISIVVAVVGEGFHGFEEVLHIFINFHLPGPISK